MSTFHKGLIGFICLWLLSSLGMAQEDRVVFSSPGGIYDQSFSVVIGNLYPNNHIRYTTNGSTPTVNSTLYDGPLFLDESLYSTSDIYTIPVSPPDLVYIPDSVRHTIVIRAAAFDQEGHRVSKTITNTYLIRSLGFESNNMAIVSICADSLALFDHETGIFVPGTHWDPNHPDHSGNYYQHGEGWERPVNFEFFEPDGNGRLNQMCGLRTHGNRSRRQPAKGMKIYADVKYGNHRFVHHFFKNASLKGYKHLILKPFATFWPYSGVQDCFSSELAIQVGLESPHCRPILLYLNGEYWGMYFIQEKMDERYLEDHLGTDAEICNIIGNWKGVIEHGDNTNFNQMLRWFNKADLTKTTNYDYACSLIDMENFIDYYVFQTFTGNNDWPGNNMRCWQEGDGKWRWLFFDGDATIIHPTLDAFANAAVYTPPTTWGNYPEAKLLFGKLLTNAQFRKAFKEKAKELCGGLFQYDHTFTIFNDLANTLSPKINHQTERFGYPESYALWEKGNSFIDDFLKNRVEYYLDEMDRFMDSIESSNSEPFTCFHDCTNGKIHVKLNKELPQPTPIMVFDATGQLCYHRKHHMTTIEITDIDANLTTGVYYVRIASYTQRLVIF